MLAADSFVLSTAPCILFCSPGDSNCQKITELEDKNVVDKRAKKKVQVKIRNKKRLKWTQEG